MTIKQIGGVFGRNPEFNDVEVTGALDLPDGVVASFGDNKDFQIVHDGTNTILNDVGDGNVFFRTNSQFNLTASNGAVGLQFNPGVNVHLRHNNVLKFTTTSNGVGVFGNVVMLTAGGGIDFSATSDAAGRTSELFDDYEEGTWTPTFTAEWTTATTVTSAQYTKTGRQVTVTLLAVGGIVTAGGGIGGLPFASNSAQGSGAYGGNSDTTASLQGTVGQSASSITNIPARILTGNTWQITATYFT